MMVSRTRRGRTGEAVNGEYATDSKHRIVADDELGGVARIPFEAESRLKVASRRWMVDADSFLNFFCCFRHDDCQ